MLDSISADRKSLSRLPTRTAPRRNSVCQILKHYALALRVTSTISKSNAWPLASPCRSSPGTRLIAMAKPNQRSTDRTPTTAFDSVSKCRVISQIDIKPREWPANTLLAACFERGGLGSFEPMFGGPTWKDGRSSYFHTSVGKADLVLTSGYRVSSTPHKLAAKLRSGGRLVAWHGEQIYGEWAYETKLNLSQLREYTRHIDAHLVWGTELAGLLRSKCGIGAERIFIVGATKFDLLRPPFWQKAAPSDEVVLFVSDFRFAELEGEDYRRAASVQGWGDEVPALQALYAEARTRFIDCIFDVASAAPHEKVLVRVHPGEKVDAYARLLSLPNVAIDAARDTFASALERAKVVLQFTSTSYFESLAANIPTYCIDLVGWRGEQVQEQYYRWVTPDGLLHNLDTILAGKFDCSSERPADALSRFFSHEEGPAIPRTLAALRRLCGEEYPVHWNPKDFARMGGFSGRHLLKEVSARVVLAFDRRGARNRWASRAREAQIRYEQGPDYIAKNEVTEWTAHLLSSYDEYIDSVITKSALCKFVRTDVGMLVTAP